MLQAVVGKTAVEDTVQISIAATHTAMFVVLSTQASLQRAMP